MEHEGINDLLYDMTRDELADMLSYLWLIDSRVTRAAIKAYRKLINLKG